MSASRFRALAYLAYRAVLAHPFKRLAQRGSALERFLASYATEGLVPTRPEDRAVGEDAAACISCGLCEPLCDLAGVAPQVRSLGIEAAFRLYSRSSVALAVARAPLEACAPCRACDDACPTGVPIARVVQALLARVSSRG